MSINGFTIGDIKLLIRESVLKAINKSIAKEGEVDELDWKISK